MSSSFPDSLLICTTFTRTHTHISRSICVCMHVYVCVYILATGLDPSELAALFCVLLGVGKRRDPFSQLPWPRPGLLGAPVPPLTQTPRPPLSRSPPSLPSHPIQTPAYLLSKAGPPSQPFINTSHYSSPRLHRDSKEISTLLVRPEAPQPFGPHKCKFRLSNLPVLIFVLKRGVHAYKTISTSAATVFAHFAHPSF